MVYTLLCINDAATTILLLDPICNPHAAEAAFGRLLKTFLLARYLPTQHIGGEVCWLCTI